MIAVRLRAALAVEMVALIAAAMAALRDGWPALAVTAAGAASFVAANSLPLAAAALIACSRAAPGRRRLPPLGEWAAYLAVFILIQPFERLWMGRDDIGRLAPGRVPVLLVHGYLCNRGLWWCMRRRLRRQGIAIATVDLEPPFAGLDQAADALAARIASLKAETGAAQVALLGHSSGGLVARAYLRRHGGAGVTRLLTLGSPHHGSLIARFGPGRSAREMEPGSRWLAALADGEPREVPTLSLWSRADEFVVPPESARLPGAREIVLPATGHLALVFSPRVAAIVAAELAADGPVRSECREGAG